jgi:hypothetical protein
MPKIDSAETECKLSIVRSKVNSEVINQMNPVGTTRILPSPLGGLLRFQSDAGNYHSQFALVASGPGWQRFIKLEIDT